MPPNVCTQHHDTCETLKRIELGVVRIESQFASLGSRLLLVERVVFGAVGLILVSVLVAILALVVRSS